MHNASYCKHADNREKAMNILIAGANGRVGSELARTLAAQGHSVRAGARNPGSSLEGIPGIEHLQLDLTASQADIDAAVAASRAEAVYFTASSRGRNLLQVDAFGAVKLMNATKAAGIRRYIQLSSVFALEPARWGEKFLAGLTNYNIAKFLADDWALHRSGLDITILQPGTLQEIPASGHIQTGVQEPMANSIGNVAATLAALLAADNTIGKVITMADGDTPIADALKNI